MWTSLTAFANVVRQGEEMRGGKKERKKKTETHPHTTARPARLRV